MARNGIRIALLGNLGNAFRSMVVATIAWLTLTGISTPVLASSSIEIVAGSRAAAEHAVFLSDAAISLEFATDTEPRNSRAFVFRLSKTGEDDWWAGRAYFDDSGHATINLPPHSMAGDWGLIEPFVAKIHVWPETTRDEASSEPVVVAEKRFWIMKNIEPLPGALSLLDDTPLREGDIARIGVAIAPEERFTASNYRLTLFRPPERTGQLLTTDEPVEPFTDIQISAANWETEIELEIPAGNYELRLHDHSGWVYAALPLTVLRKPMSASVRLEPDPLFENRHQAVINMQGTTSVVVVRVDGPVSQVIKKLESMEGEGDVSTWEAIAANLQAGQYEIREQRTNIVIGRFEAPDLSSPEFEDEILVHTAAATGVASTEVVGLYGVGELAAVRVEVAESPERPWTFELRPYVEQPVFSGDSDWEFDDATELYDEGESAEDIWTEDEERLTQEAPLRFWRLASGEEILRFHVPEDPGHYRLHGFQEVADGDNWDAPAPLAADFRIVVVPDLSQASIRVTGGTPGSAPGIGSNYRLEIELPDQDSVWSLYPPYSLDTEIVRLRGTLPDGTEVGEQTPVRYAYFSGGTQFTGMDRDGLFPSETTGWPFGTYEARLFLSRENRPIRLIAADTFQLGFPDLGGTITRVPEEEADGGDLLFDVDISVLEGGQLYQPRVYLVKSGSFHPSGVRRMPVLASQEWSDAFVDSRDGPKRISLAKPPDFGRVEYLAVLEGGAGCFAGACRRVILDTLKLGLSDTYAAIIPSPVRRLLEVPDEIRASLANPPGAFPGDEQCIDCVAMVSAISTGDSVTPTTPAGEEPVRLPFYFEKPVTSIVSGHYPAQPQAGEDLTIGFRLIKWPDLSLQGVKAEFAFLDGQNFRPIPEISTNDNRCSRGENGDYTCNAGDIGLAELKEFEFSGRAPETDVLWFANLNDNKRLAEKVEVGRIRVRGPPRDILTIIVLEDQTAEVASDSNVFAFGYPDTQGRSSGSQTRTLFVAGYNLPQKPGQTFNLESAPNVAYALLDYPDTENVLYKEQYRQGWSELRAQLKLQPNEDIPDNYQALLIRAVLLPNVMPGEKVFRLNGRVAGWDLRFGGLSGRIDFVRGSTGREVIETAYVPERIRVRISTSQPLPITTVALVLHEIMTDGSVRKRRLEAIRVTPTTYLSDPIRLVDKGRPHLSPPPWEADVPIDVFLNGRGPTRLRVEVEPRFAAQSFAIPVAPKAAAITLSRSPGAQTTVNSPVESSWLFKSALTTAARCNDQEIHDWDALSEQTAKSLWNVVVLRFFADHIRSIEVKLGHHAAMILLRDMFVEMLGVQLRKIRSIKEKNIYLLSFLESMRPHAVDRNFPINRIKIKGLDNRSYEYGYWALPHDDRFLAGLWNTSTAKVREWRVTATHEALSKLEASTEAIINAARQARDCDVKELLKLTGFGFDAVRTRLRPRLMTLTEEQVSRTRRHLYWTYDITARNWLNEIEDLAKAVRRQQRLADEDTNLLVAAATFATLPLALAESAPVAVLAFLIDLSATTYSAATEFSQVLDSQAELDFSRKAAVVIGYQRHDEAARQAKSWISALTMVGLSAGPMAADVIGLHSMWRSGALTLKGMQITSSLGTRSARSLSDIELRYFLTYAARSKARQIAEGAQNLTDLERRAIAAVDELQPRSAASGRRLSDPADTVTGLPTAVDTVTGLPTARGLDTATGLPTNSLRITDEALEVRFRVDSDGGSASMHRLARSNEATGSSVTPASSARSRSRSSDAGEQDSATLGSHENSVHEILQLLTDTRLRGRAMVNRSIEVEVDGEIITLHLGDYVGSGAYTTVLMSPGNLGMDFPQVVKITFRREPGRFNPAQADSYAYRELSALNLESVQLPRTVRSYRVTGQTGQSAYIAKVEVVEYFDGPAYILARRNGGQLTDAQQAAYVRGVRELNRRGYAWLDIKNDNFTFAEVDGVTRLVIIDPGGIVKLKGQTLSERAFKANRLQSIVNGHISRSAEFQASPRYGMEFRKLKIIEDFTGEIDDLDQLGISTLERLGFTPGGGEQFRYTQAAFEETALQGPIPE